MPGPLALGGGEFYTEKMSLPGKRLRRKAAEFVAAHRAAQAGLVLLALFAAFRTAALVRSPVLRGNSELSSMAAELARNGDLQGADRLYEIVIKRKERSGLEHEIQPWLALARNRQAMGRPDLSLGIYQRLRERPLPLAELDRLNLEMARFFVEAGRYDDAAVFYRAVMGGSPRPQRRLHAEISLIGLLALQGRDREAAREYERLLAETLRVRAEAADQVRLPLAGVYAKTGRTPEALLLLRAVAGGPSASPGLRARALSELEALNERERAVGAAGGPAPEE
jgi:hypothetical protein